jgi:Secretion system C-terminal sorting domain
MRKNLLITLFLIFTTFFVKAQSISILSTESANNYCAGTAMTVRYSTSNVTFKAGNNFKVQIQRNSNVWQDLVTEEISAGVLKVMLPNTLGISPNTGNYAYFRLTSSDPSIVSSTLSSGAVNELPNLQITGINSNNGISQSAFNPFEIVSLSSTISIGNFPFTVTFSDSSVIQMNSYSELKLHPEKTGLYSISKISNICGLGKSSGSVNITVNPSALKITNLNTAICQESVSTINYSTTATFEKDNKFVVRFKRDLQDKEYYDVDGTMTEEGVISFKVGANVPANYYQAIQLISTKPAITSPNKQASFQIAPKASVEVTSASTSINYGQRLPVQITYSGWGPFNIKMNDGSKIILSESYSTANGNTYSLNTYPEKDTQYFVESFLSGCGAGTGKNKMAITVKNNIKIDSIPTERYCAGTKVKVRIKSNNTLSTAATYFIRMKASNGFTNAATLDAEAKLTDGTFLEFIVPSGIESKLGSRSLLLAVVANNVAGEFKEPRDYNTNTLKVLDKPQAQLGNTFSESFTKPSKSYVYLDLKGGGNLVVELSDGNKYRFNNLSDYSGFFPGIEVYTQKTTAYSVKSVANECGTGSVSSNLTKTVSINSSEANYVYLQSSNVTQKVSYCEGEKIKYSITTEGSFQSDNEWKFEIIKDGYSQSTQFFSSKDKASEITIPSVTEAGFYKVRVYSTSPITYSNYFYVFLNTKPRAYVGYSSYGYEDKIIGSVTLSGGAPFEVVFSDGTKKTIGREGSTNGSETNDNYFEKINPQLGIFELKSVSNACGIGIIDSYSRKIEVVPYQVSVNIRTTNPEGILCNPVNISLAVNFNGAKANEVPYSVQISSTNDTNYTTVASKQIESLCFILLSDKYRAGSYRFRIVTEDSYKIKSNPITFQLGGSLSDALLSLNSTTSINETTINGGNSANLFIQNMPTYGSSYVIKDNLNQFYSNYHYSSSQTASFNVQPLKTTTYTLKSVSSNCGYSKASGNIKINIRPVVNATIQSYANAYCPSSDVIVKTTTFGEFEKNNIFKVFIYKNNDTTTIKEIATISNIGTSMLKLPSDLERGSYTLRIESSNPKTVKNFSGITVTALPDVTLSGGSIINSGGTAYLNLKIKGATNEVLEYELSDNTKGNTNSFYYDSFLIPVTPKTTTTYTLTSIKNVCGLGKSSGSAKIEVNPASDKQVNFDTQNFYYATFCTGSTISIPFITKGTFSAGNTFTVQMSDAQGTNFKDLKTEGTKSPLIAVTPVGTPIGGSYLFKVVASDKDATSTTNLSGLTAFQGATARFDTASYYFSEGKPVKIDVKFTGTAPFYFSLGTDEISAKNFSSSKPIYELTLTPTTPTKFKLFNVSDGYCGRGSVIEPSVVSLELITASEDYEEMQINLFPNPTSDIIYINSDGKKADIELTDITGISILQKQIKTEQEELNISKMKAGTYFLRVSKNDKQVVFKVVKL